MLGSKQASLVSIDLAHKPTIFEVARDKSDRRGKDCLYPNFDIPGQTNLFLSSHHLLFLTRHILVLKHLSHQRDISPRNYRIDGIIFGLLLPNRSEYLSLGLDKHQHRPHIRYICYYLHTTFFNLIIVSNLIPLSCRKVAPWLTQCSTISGSIT